MSSGDDRGNRGKKGNVQKPDPNNAAVDSKAAALQDQIRKDHDRLEESARRVDASVPASVRNTPIQHSEASDRGTTTDRQAAAKMDRVKADHDALEESAQRVKASVPADVRNTPVQPSMSDADAARDNARRVDNEADRKKR